MGLFGKSKKKDPKKVVSISVSVQLLAKQRSLNYFASVSVMTVCFKRENKRCKLVSIENNSVSACVVLCISACNEMLHRSIQIKKYKHEHYALA